jgi:hypothetical protein
VGDAKDANLTFLREQGRDLEELVWEGYSTPVFEKQFYECIHSLSSGPSSLRICGLKMDDPPFPISGTIRESDFRPVHTKELTPLLRASPNLRIFEVQICGGLSVKLLLHLPGCLQSLSLARSARLYEGDFDVDLDLISAFQKLTNLTHLTLDMGALSCATISSMIKHCTKLKVVSLLCDREGYPNMWVDLFQASPFLTKVSLEHCKHLTDEALGYLRNLTFLSLTSCKSITDTGVRQLVRNNPVLRTLRLTRCYNLTYDVLLLLDDAKALTSIYLSFCIDFEREVRSAQMLIMMETLLLRTYPQLQHIELD